MAAPKGHAKYEGAGRPKGTPNRSTLEIKEILLEYTDAAAIELARLAAHATNEQVRVMAIKEIFDRVYGKPVQAIVGGDGKPLLPEDSGQVLAMMARKVALAFRLAAMDYPPPMIEGKIEENDG